MGNVVKVSWSGGKDSSCAVMQHIYANNTAKVVCYIPMFTDTIPLITKVHYEFIFGTAERFRQLGAEVYIVTGMTYYCYVTHRSTRGKFKGRAFGFPGFIRGQCGFKRDSKLKALAQCDVGAYEYEDVGIAADEISRHGQLTPQKRSILCELGITEKQAWAFCKEHQLLSPHYDLRKRDGCALCPNAPILERQRWFQDYPEAVPVVIELQEFVKRERPGQTPLRNYRWFIEEDIAA